MKKILSLFIMFILLFAPNVYAETRTGYMKKYNVLVNGDETKKLHDNDFYSLVKINHGDTIEVSAKTNIKSIYIIYSLYSKKGNITYPNNFINIGENGYLHELIELNEETKILDITYDDDVTIKEIYAFDSDTPEWVQKWNLPHEDADILVYPAHSDDEHLFFAGLIPKMINDDKKIQIVYFTIHNSRPIRLDEQLDGLWAAGVRNYPVIGIVPDAYSTSLNGALTKLKEAKMTKDEIIKFEVDTVRRFKPEVIVLHDEKGEYGHGQHRLSTNTMEEALKYFNDETYESEYEPFSPYKVYIHLYNKNKIVMDYDTPLEKFNGMTAFKVSMYAFSKHVTQQYQVYGKWQKLDKATEIKEYSPMYYGLYYSSVGYENVDNDMFYNIPKKEEPKIEPTTTTTTTTQSKKEIKNKTENTKIIKTILTCLVLILIVLDILLIIFQKQEKKTSK